jgi:3-hydroxyisobutyrate dehydrogenase-like beta-hydroxyacid dehydrogenase
MGAAMAAHLSRAGHTVAVFNRSPAKAEAWSALHAGRVARTPAEAAEGAQIVFLCVGRDEDVRQVLLGEGLPGGEAEGVLSRLTPGAVVVDHTTTSADLARQMAQACAARGVSWIDAPVSGGNVGAEQGTLTVMCGGEPAAFDRVQPVIMAFARAVTLLGPAGSGQLAKMVNQISVAGLLQGLSEALAFGQKAGLDMNAVLQVITQGAAGSWQMNHRGPTMLDDRFDFGFAVDWMRKDLGLVLDEGRRLGARLPVTALVDQFYADLQAQGDGRLDTSSLIKRLR